MNSLIDELLSVTRLEQGSLTMTPVPVDVLQLTEEILQEHKVNTEKKSLEVLFQRPDTFPTVQVDLGFVREVLSNLLSNAIKYTSKNGKIIITLEQHKEDWCWKIQDSGIGIPKESQAHIFEKLYRTENAKTHAPDGNGLGLYLVKLIVQQLGGIVSFVSEEKKGATFTVCLPIVGQAQKGDKAFEERKDI